jgi:hypothetical protein
VQGTPPAQPAYGAPQTPAYPTPQPPAYGASPAGGYGAPQPQPYGAFPAYPPGGGYLPPGTVGSPVSSRLAWLIACTPLLGVVFALIGTAVGGSATMALVGLGSALTWLASLLLAVADSGRLRGAAWRPVPWAWALLGPWVYLLVRAIRRGGAPDAGWPMFVVALVLSIVAGVVFVVVDISALGLTTRYDEATVEEQIAQGIQDQTGTSVTVTCPATEPMLAGWTFTCTADDGSTTKTVTVTIKDSKGDMDWKTD